MPELFEIAPRAGLAYILYRVQQWHCSSLQKQEDQEDPGI
jgi:hypothetical protein